MQGLDLSYMASLMVEELNNLWQQEILGKIRIYNNNFIYHYDYPAIFFV
jgi:hypothetical protein